MKKILMLCSICVTLIANAQVKPATKPAAKPAPSPLKNLTDSASYAFGVNLANNLLNQGLDKLNAAMLQKAMNDVYAKKTLLLQQAEGVTAINTLFKQGQYKKYPALKEGEDFLAANAKKTGIIVLPSGLQYEVLQQADSGTIGARPFDTVIVHYAGSLVNGTEFENSFKTGRPYVTQANEVIQGWIEALQLMHVGDKWKVYIPSELAYHLKPRDPRVIPPGSALIFIMQLEGVKLNTNPPAMNQMMGY